MNGKLRNMTAVYITCKWFFIDEITCLEMPFTAKYVVEHYYSVGCITDKLYVGVVNEGVDFLELSES